MNPKLVLLLITVLAARSAFADLDPRVIQKNKEALKSFLKKDFAKAQDNLGEALTLDAADPYTRFNWATNKLFSSVDEQAGKVSPKIVEEAIKELETLNKDLARLPAKSRPNIDKEVHYQLGEAYELAKQNDKALENYYASLLSGASGTDLDKKTKNNISRLLTQQQNGGGGGGDDKDKKDGGDKGKDKKPGDDKDKQKAKDGEDANQNKQKARFDQTDVSEQEARQIMESVKGEEQEVQKRKTQAEARARASKDGNEKGNPSESSGKQW